MKTDTLFPDKATCLRQVNKFPKKDSDLLEEIWKSLVQQHNTTVLQTVEPKVVRRLSAWQAYRNQRSQRNDHFLSKLAGTKAVTNSLFKLVDATQSGSLHSVISFEKEMELLYNFLKQHMLEHGYARIVTVSKALLMIAGFSLGLDTKILTRLRTVNPNLVAASGVWPFCLYQEHLRFIADQQLAWERLNGRMSDLSPGVPIGQIMDRILWT